MSEITVLIYDGNSVVPLDQGKALDVLSDLFEKAGLIHRLGMGKRKGGMSLYMQSGDGQIQVSAVDARLS